MNVLLLFVFCLEVAFFSLVAGMSIVSGFATTLMLAKRRDSEMFDKVTEAFIMLCKLYLVFRLLQPVNL